MRLELSFERDYKRYIEYRFFGLLFPISLNATPVSYDGSQILKATASFHYDRYYAGQSRSLDAFLKRNGNRQQPASSGTISQQQLNKFMVLILDLMRQLMIFGIRPLTANLFNEGSDANYNFGFNSKDDPYTIRFHSSI